VAIKKQDIPALPNSDRLTEGLCVMCSRTTYVREDGELICPVCSSPLVAVTPPAEPPSK
jgi:uncharacterized Zn finger protein (UPF0148 family)